MVESGGGAGVSEPLPGAKTTSSYESSGGRVRFTVEIRPGETAVISWTKLVKEATSSKPKGTGSSVSFPSSEAHQQPVFHPLTSVMAPFKNVAQSDVKEAHSQAGPNRFSNVIQKIERIYAGNGSSEEEDAFLNDVLDDDEYDTDDSFIDDTELDDYFQVDNSALKHDGFFVNRGELEHIEPNAITDQQPKKRRREDAIKRQNGDNDVHDPNKQTKIGYRLKKSTERNSNCLSHRVTGPSMLTVEVPYDPSISHASEISKKTTADTKVAMNPSGLSSGEGKRQSMDTDQQRTGILTSHDHNSKLNEDYELQEPSAQGSNDKSLPMSGSQSGIAGKFGLNAPPGVNITRELENVPVMPRKDGSKVRSRSSMLDKAIRELEKIVAEAGPPSMAVHDPGNSSQTLKRRLPQDIKKKLAKVARLADKEKLRKSTFLAQKMAQPIHEKLQSDSQNHSLPSTVKPVSSTTVSQGSSCGKLKLQSSKGSSSNSSRNAMPFKTKKKVKRKPSTGTCEARLTSEERCKHHKHVAMPVHKSNSAPAG